MGHAFDFGNADCAVMRLSSTAWGARLAMESGEIRKIVYLEELRRHQSWEHAA